MTVKELKKILNNLPDDMELDVRQEDRISMIIKVYEAQKAVGEMTDDPTKLQLIYLSQIPMVLASIDDSLKSIRQTLSNMTGVIKEGQNDKNN